MSSLFRSEAVEHVTRRLSGEVLIGAPLSVRALSAGLAAVVFCALIFVSLGTYARKETASGWLVPVGGLVEVTTPSGGRVTALGAPEGGALVPGTVLATIAAPDQSAGAGTRVASPVAGRLAMAMAKPDQVLRPGAVVGVVIPSNTKLEAELYLPSRAAGSVRPGQAVTLHYQAFPYQKFGAGDGIVRTVSLVAAAPSDISNPAMRFQEPMYRARVELGRDFIMTYGKKTPLLPGMLINADVVIDRRSLLEWVLDPLYAVGRRQ